MKVWVDGEVLTDPDAPVVRVTDHGLTVGDGVFEALKVVDGEPFALERHLARLARSAAGLGLDGVDVERVREGIGTVLAAEHLALGRLRVTVTGGVAPLGSGRGDAAPTVIVVGAAMDPAAPSTDVVTVPWPRNERGALAGIKTTSYAENVVALAHAHERGATEAVFANLAGHLCEGTGSNVFYAVDGEVRTPSLASGCLAGVTRDLLVEWIEVREVDEPIEVAAGADEIFLTSTTRDVQAVRRWDDRDLGDPGPVTRAAAEVWRRREPELLGLDTPLLG